MKKVLIYICLTIFLGCAMFPISEALAVTEADPYLMDGRWEMEMTGWYGIRYMNFYSDGTGIMEVPYVESPSGIHGYYNYGFTWHTYPYGVELFISITFEGDYPGYGWGVLDVPYKSNTYKLIWNPQFMILSDWTHTGTDARGFDAMKTIVLRKEQVVYY